MLRMNLNPISMGLCVLLLVPGPILGQQLVPRDPDFAKAREIMEVAARDSALAEIIGRVQDRAYENFLRASLGRREGPDPLYVARPDFEGIARDLLAQGSRAEEMLNAATLSDAALADLRPAETALASLQADAVEAATHAAADSLDRALAQAGMLALTASAPALFGGAAWEQDVVLGLVGFVAGRAEAALVSSLGRQLSNRFCKKDGVDSIMPATCAVVFSEDAVPAWGTVRYAIRHDLRTLPDSVASRSLRRISNDSLSLDGLGRYAAWAINGIRLLERGDDPVQVLMAIRDASACEPADCSEIDYTIMAVTGAAELVFATPKIAASDSALTLAARRLLESIGGRYGDLSPEEIARIETRFREGLRDLNHRLTRLRVLADTLQSEDSAARFNDYATTLIAILEQAPRFRPRPLAEAAAAEFGRMTETVRRLDRAAAALRADNYPGAFIETYSALQLWPAAAQLPGFFSTFGPVVVQLASDTSAAAVRTTLEAAAAPLGSYRAKRGEDTRGVAPSFGLNAYVGAHYGYERVTGGEDDRTAAWGIFAPIGFEASVGFWEKLPSSLGFFLSLVDLGGLMSFRADSDTPLTPDSTAFVDEDPQIGFKQIVSPGLYTILGLSDSVPFSFGVGYAVYPALRQVTEADGSTRSVSAGSWRAFMALDLPIFRF